MSESVLDLARRFNPGRLHSSFRPAMPKQATSRTKGTNNMYSKTQTIWTINLIGIFNFFAPPSTTCAVKVSASNSERHALWKQILFAAVGCFLVANTLNATCSTVSDCDCSPGFDSVVNTTISGYWRVITSNGIPKHNIGKFPMLDPTYKRPNTLSPQQYTFVMPAYSAEGILWPPKVFTLPTPPFEGKPKVTFGVAVNGVPFDPAANEWWDPVAGRVETKTNWTINPLRNVLMQYDLDCNNGHVQEGGAYHYHGYPYGLVNDIKAGLYPDQANSNRSNIFLLGWAFDGNPIYAEECGKDNASIVHAKSSYKLKTRPAGAGVPLVTDFPLADFLEDYVYDGTLFASNKSVQLDECNGHTGKTPEFPNGVYHYHILEKSDSTSDIGFPYIGRCYRLFTYGSGPNIFPKPPGYH